MKKRSLNPEVKANVTSGLSSATGSAAGVVIGSMVTQGTEAAEAESFEEEVVADSIANEDTEDENYVIATVSEGPEEDVEVEVVSSEPDITTNAEAETNPQNVAPNVLSYETVTDENGQQVDVAVVEIDGKQVGLIDLDQNGVADIAMADLNDNGELDEGEVEDVSQIGIAMDPLKDAIETSDDLVTQTIETDYVNDANVDAYYA